ncbi:MAG: response regulator transcription factor [Planctomycetes bacterium]|nr:response regulator transcription factor [Planctomycetota bacterium]
MSGDLLLIVEDEKHILRPLVAYFRAEGYRVETAMDGEAALEVAGREPPDCVILDVMLPKKTGIEVCRELRATQPLVPIVMLTALGSAGDKVLGLDSGADDYVTKPFDLVVLHARVRAQLRRARRVAASAGAAPARQVKLGACEFCRDKRLLTRDGAPVKVTAMQLKVLEYLLDHEGAVVPRSELLNEVWGYDAFPSTRTVDTHVWQLRQRIELDPNQPRHFLTVHGIGYRFLLEPES